MAKNSPKSHESKASRNGLTREFNRVVSKPGHLNGKPFLQGRDITVEEIIDLFTQGYSDKAILGKYKDKELHPSDLDACRSYQVRFMSETLPNTHKINENEKFFLMDENMSYFLLYDISATYGFCTHVGAEGLSGKDDEKDIWPHAVKHGYSAILTADSDFIDISRRHRRVQITKHGDVKNSAVNTPAVIRIAPKTERNEVVYLLKHYEDDIRNFVTKNRHTYAELGRSGLTSYEHDNIFKSNPQAANNNTNNTPKAPGKKRRGPKRT